MIENVASFGVTGWYCRLNVHSQLVTIILWGCDEFWSSWFAAGVSVNGREINRRIFTTVIISIDILRVKDDLILAREKHWKFTVKSLSQLNRMYVY